MCRKHRNAQPQSKAAEAENPDFEDVQAPSPAQPSVSDRRHLAVPEI